MSDFAKLKAQRKAKEHKAYASATAFSNADANHGTPTMQKDVSEKPVNEQGGLNRTQAEGLYPALPAELEIRVEGERGKGLFSRYPRRPGDILLSIKPHVAALSNDQLESHCSSCFGVGTSLRRCTGCRTLLYCDSACQSKDWLFHKQECVAIQRRKLSDDTSFTIAGDAIRCLGRMLWRKQKLKPDAVWARELDAMQSHRTSLSKDPNSRESQVYTQLAHALIRFLGLNSPQEMAEYGLDSATDLVDIVSRFTTNTFTITSPDLTPLGACVSPLIALINHSCEPNAVVVFPRPGSKDQEPLMQVIALKAITVEEEVLTAYVDTTLPTVLRQKQLQETYHFTCRCQLCASSHISEPARPLDLREAIFCPKKCGGICRLPTEDDSFVRCNTCHSAIKDTDAVLDAVRVGQEGLDKAEALQFSDSQKAIQLTANLVPILTSVGLVPAAHPLLGLSRLLTSLLIEHLPSIELDVEEIQSPEIQASQIGSSKRRTPQDIQEALDETIRAATRSYTGLSQILAPGHPVRGIALTELGKLLAVDEPCPKTSSSSKTVDTPSLPKAPEYPPSGPQRLKVAYDTLMRARSEVAIGFGAGTNEGGEVGKGVRKMLVDLEKEMAVWKDGVNNALRDARLAGTKNFSAT